MEDATHFLNALKAKYPIIVDIKASTYIGITLDWDYKLKRVTLSMPNYVCKALHKLGHIFEGGPEYSPFACTPIQYGQKIQYSAPLDTTATLSDKEIKIVQQVCGTFLYYNTVTNNTILPGLSSISSEQSKAKENTGKHVTKLLNYLATNPDAQI